jgi:hypothetical protein
MRRDVGAKASSHYLVGVQSAGPQSSRFVALIGMTGFGSLCKP